MPLTEKAVQHMTMQFGQFLDHDITLTPEAELDCCNKQFLEEDKRQPREDQRCFNIIALDRPKNKLENLDNCLPLTRSDICTDDPFHEQMNAITAFVDGSNVYGSDENRTRKLRTLSDGLMKTHADDETMLPTRTQCNFVTKLPKHPDELVTGDVRALIQPTLASMHTLFLAEHNKIAKDLKEELQRTDLLPTDPSMADELVFQETRKIIGALLQKITYQEYLPVILGSDTMSAQNMLSEETVYDPNVD